MKYGILNILSFVYYAIAILAGAATIYILLTNPIQLAQAGIPPYKITLAVITGIFAISFAAAGQIITLTINTASNIEEQNEYLKRQVQGITVIIKELRKNSDNH